MKQFEWKFQSGMEKFIKLFNDVLEEGNFELNQFIKGKTLRVRDDLPIEFLDNIEKLMKVAPSYYRTIEDKEGFWEQFKKLDDYDKNSIFLKWWRIYLDEIMKPANDAKFIDEMDKNTFKEMSYYCFNNYILQETKKESKQERWDNEKLKVLQKVMLNYVELIVIKTYSRKKAEDVMLKTFNIREDYCEYWFDLVDEKRDVLWKKMLLMHLNKIEKKLDYLIDIEENKGEPI